MKRSRALFAGLLLLVAIPLLLRLCSLCDLYFRPDARASVQNAMESLAEQHGWVLSDLTIASVSNGQATITHRPHHRGIDNTDACFQLNTRIHLLQPCAK